MSSSSTTAELGTPAWIGGGRRLVVTRDDVRDELQNLLAETLQRELQEVGERVQRDIREEFRHWIWQEHPSQGRPCAVDGGTISLPSYQGPRAAAQGPSGSLRGAAPPQPQGHGAATRQELLFAAGPGGDREPRKVDSSDRDFGQLPGMVQETHFEQPPPQMLLQEGWQPRRSWTSVALPKRKGITESDFKAMFVGHGSKVDYRTEFAGQAGGGSDGRAFDKRLAQAGVYTSTSSDSVHGKSAVEPASQQVSVAPQTSLTEAITRKSNWMAHALSGRPKMRTSKKARLQSKARRESKTQTAIIQAKLRATRRASFATFKASHYERGHSPTCLDYCDFVVKSDYFDYCMGVVLLANAATIGIQANYFASNKDPDDNGIPLSFRIVDGCFCIVFVLELFFRVLVYRMEFFSGEQWRWSIFDSLIVFFQVIDEFVKLIFTGTPVQDAMDNMGVIRMLRLARLIRVVRMVRLIPELKSMVYLIFASIGSFFWSLILILIMMYCFAIYYTEIATDMILDGRVPQEKLATIEDMWGNLGQSVLSLWMAITGGDDWRNFTEVFRSDNAYGLHLVFFVIYIAFGTLVMLNLVTGVFVEGAQRIIKEDKDTELLNMAAKLFDVADKDESHDITWEEFNNTLESGMMDDYIKAIGIGTQEAEHLYELLDTDESGTVSIAEFVKGCLRLRGPAKSMDMAEMEYKMRESFHDLALKLAQMGDILRAHISDTSAAIRELEGSRSQEVVVANAPIAYQLEEVLV